MKDEKDKLILDDTVLVDTLKKYKEIERSRKPKKLIFKENKNGKS